MINTRNKRDKTRNTKSKKIEREKKKIQQIQNPLLKGMCTDCIDIVVHAWMTNKCSVKRTLKNLNH